MLAFMNILGLNLLIRKECYIVYTHGYSLWTSLAHQTYVERHGYGVQCNWQHFKDRAWPIRRHCGEGSYIGCAHATKFVVA